MKTTYRRRCNHRGHIQIVGTDYYVYRRGKIWYCRTFYQCALCAERWHKDFPQEELEAIT